jgi:hypothetical protein
MLMRTSLHTSIRLRKNLHREKQNQETRYGTRSQLFVLGCNKMEAVTKEIVPMFDAE